MTSALSRALSQHNYLSAESYQLIEDKINASGVSVPEALIDLDILDSKQLTLAVCEIFALEYTALLREQYQPLNETLGLKNLVTRFQSLPIKQSSQVLTLAVSDPTQTEAEDEFRFATGLQIELVVADHKELKNAIRNLYGKQINTDSKLRRDINTSELESLVDISDEERGVIEDLSQDDAPVSRYIHQVLLEAVRKEASDIHFEPYEHSYRIRFRCDGILIESHQPAQQLGRRLSTRVKILANLDISERRLPQDGRTKLKLNEDISIDMRVSTLPTLWGEKVVLRLLDSSSAQLDIDKLGYSDTQKQAYLSALKKPQGLILMTGPTGSGKTVSLYTGLRILNTAQVNIATAEDPVEINLPGINQVQIQPQIGFDFAVALRSFLRQDPDVVMVGEIRDLETAEIAIKASQTGHLVLSTLHTNSAAETLVRLSNMGVQAFNIASSLSLIIAQRLTRRLCNHCKQVDPSSETIAQRFQLTFSTPIYQANMEGCENCNGGYSGRLGIFEVMTINSELTKAILRQESAPEIEAIAQQQGMLTLQQSGLQLLQNGVTSYQELQRVLYL